MYQSVLQRLGDLGYTKEDLPTEVDGGVWKWDDLMDQPRTLTERGMCFPLTGLWTWHSMNISLG